VWAVSEFDGEASGKEGQPLRWVDRSQLSDYDFPAANIAIIDALLKTG
jgi:8-oxo-dGTP diphosphatase